MEKIQISLAAARVNAGMTQEQVAKEMNVSKNTVINWEKGIIKGPALHALCSLYNIPIDNIFLPD